MNIIPIEYTEGMTITPPCFIANMPNDVYHSHPEGISSTGLKLVLRSPAHFNFCAMRLYGLLVFTGASVLYLAQ